ncbi:hypothetical protein G7Y89_g10177 [Cudoniella acicularis]|uniref:Uncharacterized protein n=1 Tax=Cudoniella acicularis TaxID=354080 RepID=A0A8H4REU8_9HELO|nr:hypothetical protein G7Y89_g10177 [Cudoniella acicularis]
MPAPASLTPHCNFASVKKLRQNSQALREEFYTLASQFNVNAPHYHDLNEKLKLSNGEEELMELDFDATKLLAQVSKRPNNMDNIAKEKEEFYLLSERYSRKQKTVKALRAILEDGLRISYQGGRTFIYFGNGESASNSVAVEPKAKESTRASAFNDVMRKRWATIEARGSGYANGGPVPKRNKNNARMDPKKSSPTRSYSSASTGYKSTPRSVATLAKYRKANTASGPPKNGVQPRVATEAPQPLKRSEKIRMLGRTAPAGGVWPQHKVSRANQIRSLGRPRPIGETRSPYFSPDAAQAQPQPPVPKVPSNHIGIEVMFNDQLGKIFTSPLNSSTKSAKTMAHVRDSMTPEEGFSSGSSEVSFGNDLPAGANPNVPIYISDSDSNPPVGETPNESEVIYISDSDSADPSVPNDPVSDSRSQSSWPEPDLSPNLQPSTALGPFRRKMLARRGTCAAEKSGEMNNLPDSSDLEASPSRGASAALNTTANPVGDTTTSFAIKRTRARKPVIETAASSKPKRGVGKPANRVKPKEKPLTEDLELPRLYLTRQVERYRYREGFKTDADILQEKNCELADKIMALEMKLRQLEERDVEVENTKLKRDYEFAMENLDRLNVDLRNITGGKVDVYNLEDANKLNRELAIRNSAVEDAFFRCTGIKYDEWALHDQRSSPSSRTNLRDLRSPSPYDSPPPSRPQSSAPGTLRWESYTPGPSHVQSSVPDPSLTQSSAPSPSRTQSSAPGTFRWELYSPGPSKKRKL